MPHIDYFFAPISPFTYLAGTRLEGIAARHGATISYKPLDIMALFARTGGLPPKDRHPNRQDYRMQEIRRQATNLGMPINLKPAFWPAMMWISRPPNWPPCSGKPPAGPPHDHHDPRLRQPFG